MAAVKMVIGGYFTGAADGGQHRDDGESFPQNALPYYSEILDSFIL